MPRVLFQTLGCRLNKAEEALFVADYLARGYEIVRDNPDVICLHTCAVTHDAEKESLNYLRRLRRKYPEAKIIVSGCAAECNKEEFLKEEGATTILHKSDFPNVEPHFTTKRALLKVQDGCNMKCAYCIVPQTRGSSISIPLSSVLNSAKILLDGGFKELVITGCNLAIYCDGTTRLPKLISDVASLALSYGARIRLGSIEPGLIDADLIALLQTTPNLCHYIHYPLQSLDNTVLREMGRIYTADYLNELFTALRQKFPRISLNADIITGLPYEDENAFQKSINFVVRHTLASVHIFPYSPRPGTRTLTMPHQPPRTVAQDRLKRLQSVASQSTILYKQSLLSHPTTFLIEKSLPAGQKEGWDTHHIRCRTYAPTAPLRSLVTFTPTIITNGILT